MSLTFWMSTGIIVNGIAILILFLNDFHAHQRLKNLEYLERLRSESEARSIPRPRVP